MPTYSYRCTECDTAFDIQQSFTDDSLTVCPTCQGKLRKVFSAIGVSFTGSGFYRNDARAEASASRDTKSGGKKSAEKSSDSSAAATSSEKPAKAAKGAGEKSSAAPATKESKPSASVAATKSNTGSSAPKNS